MAKINAWCPGVNCTKWDVCMLTCCWIWGEGWEGSTSEGNYSRSLPHSDLPCLLSWLPTEAQLSIPSRPTLAQNNFRP